MITRPAIRYHGGKFALSNWIISHFPGHVSYCEPYCGGANVLLRKPRSLIETINDKDDEVINFFDVLLGQTDDLIHRIGYTPYSRRIWERAWQNCGETPVQRALDFYIRSWMTFGSGQRKNRSGWRYMRRNSANIPATDWTKTDHLWQIANRLRGVQIECDDALAVIRRYDTPNTLFYVDPPYLPETRYDQDGDYRHELSLDDHRILALALNEVQGMVILSGCPSSLYEDLYAGWRCIKKAVYNNGKSQNAKHKAPKTECLWLSPNTKPEQLELWRLP